MNINKKKINVEIFFRITDENIRNMKGEKKSINGKCNVVGLCRDVNELRYDASVMYRR